MITRHDINRRVVICAADDFYAYVDGWRGTFVGFHESGHAIVHVPNEAVACGYATYLIPPDQLLLTV